MRKPDSVANFMQRYRKDVYIAANTPGISCIKMDITGSAATVGGREIAMGKDSSIPVEGVTAYPYITFGPGGIERIITICYLRKTDTRYRLPCIERSLYLRLESRRHEICQ